MYTVHGTQEVSWAHHCISALAYPGPDATFVIIKTYICTAGTVQHACSHMVSLQLSLLLESLMHMSDSDLFCILSCCVTYHTFCQEQG